jgi:hypothetical protein
VTALALALLVAASFGLGYLFRGWLSAPLETTAPVEATTQTTKPRRAQPLTIDALVMHQALDGGDYLLTFPRGDLYRGSGTVWHHYPSGERCSTGVESMLANVWVLLEWRTRSARAGRGMR